MEVIDLFCSRFDIAKLHLLVHRTPDRTCDRSDSSMSIERSAFPPCEYFPALGACEWWPSVAVVVDCFGALESVAAWASTWTAASFKHFAMRSVKPKLKGNHSDDVA